MEKTSTLYSDDVTQRWDEQLQKKALPIYVLKREKLQDNLQGRHVKIKIKKMNYNVKDK